MNTDDLRDALSRDAENQPPVSPAFAAGVEQRIHRQRRATAAIAAPFVVLVVAAMVAAGILGTRTSRDATLATAANPGTSVPSGGGSTVPAPSTTRTVPVSTSPVTTTAPTPTEPAVPGVPEPSTGAPTTDTTVPGGDCGTVVLTADPNAAFATAPFTCFLKALKAGVPADLVVQVNGPQGGSFTDHLSTGPDHLLTVTVEGSMTVTLPSFSLGTGGGPASGPAAGTAGGDCGTIDVTPTPGGGTALGSQVDQQAMRCVVAAFMSGSPATLQVVVHGAQGGAITTNLELSSDHHLTVTSNGTMRVQLPATLVVPEDLLNAIPPGSMTLNQIPGFPNVTGFGKRCATQSTAPTCTTRPTR